MPTIDTETPMPMFEVANRIAADGGIPEIFYEIEKKNMILEKLLMRPTSHETHHEYIRTLTKPSGTWGRVNKGVVAHSTRTKPEKAYCGRLEDRNEIDERAFTGLSPAAAANVRLIEDRQFASGLGENMADWLVYGSQGEDGDSFDGIYAHEEYQAVGDQVIDAGGSTALGSILVMEMSAERMYGIYPKGSKVGLSVKSKGSEPKLDSDNGGTFYVRVSVFEWLMGFVIKDPTAIVRIANIEDAASNDGSSTYGIDYSMIYDAFSRLPNIGSLDTYIFVNRRQLKNMQTALHEKLNIMYAPDLPFGRKWIRSVDGAEVMLHEGLLNTEGAVS